MHNLPELSSKFDPICFQFPNLKEACGDDACMLKLDPSTVFGHWSESLLQQRESHMLEQL